MSAPPGQHPPTAHAAKGDPRYPSARDGRTSLALLIDLSLTIGVLAAGIEAGRSGHLIDTFGYPLWVGVIGAVGVSVVNRVLLQWVVHATLGKLLLGLCVIRKSDGGRVTLGNLIGCWVATPVWFLLDEAVDEESFFPAVVRRRDVRALRERVAWLGSGGPGRTGL